MKPKQETIDEVSVRNWFNDKFKDNLWREGFKAGEEWQAERRYSEEEVLVILYEQLESLDYYGEDFSFSLFWEQFKKK